MKRFMFLFSFLVLILQAQAQRQGIQGEVFWLSGNQMPGPGKVSSPQQGVIREVHIYKVARLQDTQQQDGFFQSINTELVAKVLSNKEGQFEFKLPPGEYSVFVKEAKGLFANLIDKDGRINCVIVKPKKFSWITIAIDYEAVY